MSDFAGILDTLPTSSPASLAFSFTVSAPTPVLANIPQCNSQIVAQGLARLTSAFITKPNIRKMLAVYLQPFQDLEDAICQVYHGRVLATATVFDLPQTNIVFDIIGRIVGVRRGGLSDAFMKAVIYLQIAVNRSNALVTNWSRFAQILLPFCDTAPMYYDDQAGIYFGCWNLQLPPLAVGSVLARAVTNGVAGELAYTTWPDGNDFEWSSRADATAGQGTWGSRQDASVGGFWVAGIGLQ